MLIHTHLEMCGLSVQCLHWTHLWLCNWIKWIKQKVFSLCDTHLLIFLESPGSSSTCRVFRAPDCWCLKQTSYRKHHWKAYKHELILKTTNHNELFQFWYCRTSYTLGRWGHYEQKGWSQAAGCIMNQCWWWLFVKCVLHLTTNKIQNCLFIAHWSEFI